MAFAIHAQFTPNLRKKKGGEIIKGAQQRNSYDIGAIEVHNKVCESHMQFY